MKTKQPLAPATRLNASEPFVFSTSAPYELGREDLKAQTDKGVQRTRNWLFPKITILSCSNAVMQMKATNEQKEEQVITIQVGADSISVRCDCGAPVKTVCTHAYHVLYALDSYTAPFEQYKPGGLYEMALLYPAAFEPSPWGKLQYRPKEALKTVYRLNPYKPCDLPEAVFTQPGKVPAASEAQMALCFILIEAYRTRSFSSYKRLPAISPCLGTLTMTGREIKGFDRLLSGTQKAYSHLLTPNQQELNRLGLAMWKLVEQLPGRLCFMPDEQQVLAAELFLLWEAALPLLCSERFTFAYSVHFVRQLKEKPRKKRLCHFTMSPQRPRLFFVLEDFGIYYKLKAAMAIYEKPITGFELANPFFIYTEDKYFLLASLRDVLLMEWMEKLDQQVTIFKEHFPDFDKAVLQPLRRSYDVVFTQRKKQQP